MLRFAVTAVLLAALTGCSPAGRPAADAPAGIKLTATLESPVDITLDWTGTPSGASGTIVEFATEPDGRYTILAFLDPGQHTYQHPDLMPGTPFYHRITPILGPASSAVAVKLPATTIFRGAAGTARPGSVRTGAGAPTEPAVTPVGADQVRVSWRDNASDEDGFLLEIRPAGTAQYRVAGFVDPDSTSTELSTLAAERDASYRVRAFYRGTASNLTHQTTGGAF